MTLVTPFARLLSEPVPIPSTDGRVIIAVSFITMLGGVAVAWISTGRAGAKAQKAEEASGRAEKKVDQVVGELSRNGGASTKDEVVATRSSVARVHRRVDDVVGEFAGFRTVVNDRMDGLDRSHKELHAGLGVLLAAAGLEMPEVDHDTQPTADPT